MQEERLKNPTGRPCSCNSVPCMRTLIDAIINQKVQRCPTVNLTPQSLMSVSTPPRRTPSSASVRCSVRTRALQAHEQRGKYTDYKHALPDRGADLAFMRPQIRASPPDRNLRESLADRTVGGGGVSAGHVLSVRRAFAVRGIGAAALRRCLARRRLTEKNEGL